MDKEVYLGLEKAVHQNLEAARIIVTSVRWSTPHKPSTKMLVFADGTTVGTMAVDVVRPLVAIHEWPLQQESNICVVDNS